MSGLSSASSSPGLPTPDSMVNSARKPPIMQGALPDIPPPPGFTTRRMPVDGLRIEHWYSQPRPPIETPSFTSGGYWLPPKPPTPLHVCPKHHRVPLAPPGYHWLEPPVPPGIHGPFGPVVLMARETQPPALFGPRPSTEVLPFYGISASVSPPHALWCPITLSWYPASPNSCHCPLLPTWPQKTGWTPGGSEVPPHSWLLRPPGYDVYPAPYMTSKCRLCQNIGSLGLVRNGCPAHDPPVR
ncbi:hypothetical protein B0I37DRAFT_370510 [Chaetomium sp. MPI-CAGE-AT-0009]|nr:hypothetical protein B0I37DRAFT_370510 [Chaetomium sp. MPI-CAGE-AT-0009]